MSSTQSNTRFSDENYKNWLKTAESLYILRNRIQDFIEKETETYHNSLRQKQHLTGKTCNRNCDDKNINRKTLCQLCANWKNEIVANHNVANNIHWNNCRPHLWSTEKWEVAKAYMPRGHRQHSKFSQFDVAAILNLMSFCKHFKIQGQYVSKVINVRNSVMHSPDLKMSNEDLKRHCDTVLQLAKILEPQIPQLKDLGKEIKQFNNTLDQNFNQSTCEVDGQPENVQTLKLLDREQQALKDRIEDFISRFEGNQDENVEEKPQDIKQIMEFLDQNKDLLENLGPEVSKLKEIQTKVVEHEEQISTLKERMDQLEKVKQDPLFPGNPLKFKNHLYEYCRAKKWPEPVFTETQEPQGYMGEVTVNGTSFTGTRVFNDKKAAHQEVAHIALEQLKLLQESADEPSSSITQPEASSSSSSENTFFGRVTVELDSEVESDRFSSTEEATEAAYNVLGESFHISAPVEGRTYRSLIMEYFNTHCFQKPSELLVQNDDNSSTCKLKLSGPFTFYDKDGSTRKKQAEQQAAEVALQHLSGILNCAPIPESEKNFKGLLKECLEMRGLKSPIYTTEKKAEIIEEQVTGSISPDPTNSAVLISQPAVKEPSMLKSENICKSEQHQLCQEPASVPVSVPPDPQNSSSPVLLIKKPRIDGSGITFFSKVTVSLKHEVTSDRRSSKDEAAEAAYKSLLESFCIKAPAEGQTCRSVIMDHFNKHDLQIPAEEFVDDDNNTSVCILKLRPFTFYDKDGSTRKKQAEQQAAKVALQHLSGILKCAPISNDITNFKGVLKECLESHNSPIYENEEYKKEVSEEPGTTGMSPNLSNLSISQKAVMEHFEFESISTSAQDSVSVPASVLVDPQDSSSGASIRKKPRIDFPEISELLNIYNLKPPHVSVENMKCDQNFKCTVKISLDEFTCSNKQGYDSKKEAIRKTYLLFGCAVSILDSSTDEKVSVAEVKKHFSQNSLPFPHEDVCSSAKPFYCSLKIRNYKVDFNGQGFLEDEAKLCALQNALHSLSPLFDYPSVSGADHPEAVLTQLSSMLRSASQKDPVISLDVTNQACVQLSFCDYTMKCTCQSSKKAARNHVSARILGLLGVKAEVNDASLRNRLDEWFTQHTLPKPVFEDTEEVLGAKATFSVLLSCCSPGWEDIWETAKMNLLQVLKHRFQFLDDKNN